MDATHQRDQMESLYQDKIVIIGIETGKYVVDDDALAANKRALAKHPGAALYGLRVGAAYLYEFGSGLAH